MNRIEKLKARLVELEKKKEIELTSEDVSERYVSDLNNSIQSCKTELGFLEENPDGVKVI